MLQSSAADEVTLFYSQPQEIPEHLKIPENIYSELNKTQSYLDFKLNIAQVTDIHHYSEKLYNADSPVFEQFSYNNEGRTVLYTKELLYTLKDELLRKGINKLLVTGDLSVLGAEATHRELSSIFSDFTADGISVFVTTGNHDLNNPRAFRITDKGTAPVETVDPELFREIYYDFGYSEAVMAHDETLSYLAELGEGYLLLSLDTSYYQDNFNLNYSVSPGILLQSLYDFVSKAVDYAETEAKQILVTSHHNFLEHYEIDFDLSNFMIIEPQPMIEKLKAGGVNLALSGHIHKSDIKLAEVAGEPFYAASLNAFAQYPHTYRLLGLGDSGAGISDFSLAYEPESGLRKEVILYDWYIYYNRNFLGQYEKLLSDHSKQDAESMAEYFFLANLYSQQGLEEFLPSSVASSKGARLFLNSSSFMKGFAAALPLDSPPSDSDVRLDWQP